MKRLTVLSIGLLSYFLLVYSAQASTLSNGTELIDDGSKTMMDQNQNGIPDSEEGIVSAEEAGNLGGVGSFTQTQQGSLEGTDMGQDKGSGVNALGLAMGAMFTAMCSSSNPAACAMAAKSFMDAMSGSEAQDSAKASAFTLGQNPDEIGGPENETSSGNSEAQQGLKNLADMGFTVNPDGSVNTPDGQTLSTEDFSSEQALMDKGFTPAQAQQAMNQLEDVKQRALEKVGEDQGQAITAAGAINTDKEEYSAASGSNLDSASLGGNGGVEIEYRKRKKKKVEVGRMTASEASQLTRNFNGDPIGIGMGNLFMIVRQKYIEKKGKHEFFNKEYGN